MKCFLTVIIFLALTVIISPIYGQQWIPHIIDSNLYNATIIDTADIDEDGDLDIAANGNNKVQWYENNSPDTNWTKHTIDNSFFGTVGIAIRDFDGDSKLDVVASGYTDSDVRWYKNEGGTPINWHKYIIDDDFLGAEFLCVDDIDDDGDPDVVVTGAYGNSVAWYENNLPDTNWSKHKIADGNLPGATNCYVGDIDDDGDLDVAATGKSAHDLVWFENNLPDTIWNRITIDGSLSGAWGVCIADIDGNDTLDVVATGMLADKVVWYKTEDAGQTWNQKIIYPDYFDGARNVDVAHIDGDGDLDVVATAYDAGVVVWFENDLPNNWTRHNIDTNLDGANDVFTADVDGDGKLDVIATGRIAYDLIWYENNIIDGIEPLAEIMPTEFSLSQNHPNPFNPATKIRYSIPQLSKVTIKVFDILGTEIETLEKKKKPIGTYEITWNSENLPSGIYFYRINAGDYAETKKMVLMK